MDGLIFLVVDDSPPVLSLVKNTLLSKAFTANVHTALDGEQAIESLTTHDIDLIISDWEMPKVSGEELLYFVRNNTRYKETPFIMMTTYSSRDFIITAIQNGVSHYIVKPFTAEKLIYAIRKSWGKANKRLHKRYYHLPSNKVTLCQPGENFIGYIKNFARSGVLIEMPYHKELELFGLYNILLVFFDPSINVNEAFTVKGQIIRMEASSMLTAPEPTCELAFQLDLVASIEQIDSVIKMLKQYSD